MKIDSDVAEFLFRFLFCSIFVGLGGEHLFADTLIRQIMPAWVPFPRLVSVLCGLWLISWGSLILLGWHIRAAALALGAFLVVVTIAVHVPGIFARPDSMTEACAPFWDILQRSNLVKNLCLLGVCFLLLHHRVGRYSIESYVRRG
jgi:uncharacterized membrane protein YphA (DoxX/SURF4 family)